jgi:hypothetical protein
MLKKKKTFSFSKVREVEADPLRLLEVVSNSTCNFVEMSYPEKECSAREDTDNSFLLVSAFFLEEEEDLNHCSFFSHQSLQEAVEEVLVTFVLDPFLERLD